MAQPIRLLLEHTGVEWEDKLYACGPAPDFDKTCWFGVKESLGFDFPNVRGSMTVLVQNDKIHLTTNKPNFYVLLATVSH